MNPLNGLKILDFSTLLPGPYATQILADMGAEVLRIEAPDRPDLISQLPPFVNQVSAAHASINRNKKNIAIDLKHPEAKKIILQLIQEYDIIIEQFRPGVMKKFGLSYQELNSHCPNLIYCSITGYGQTGPLKDRAGHDINFLALSGLASFSGQKNTGPVLSGTQIADIAGGSHHAVMAVLAAVIQRGNLGTGQYLDISMTDATLALTTLHSAGTLVNGQSPSYGTELLNGGNFYGYYETKDGGYLSIGSLEPQFASEMLKRLTLEDWQNNIHRNDVKIQAALRCAIAEKIKRQSLSYWQEIFSDLDLCIEPVLSLKAATEHPHFIERQMLTTAVDDNGQTIKQINSPLPFNKNKQHSAGRSLGADTQTVLTTLGLTHNQIQELYQSKCIQ